MYRIFRCRVSDDDGRSMLYGVSETNEHEVRAALRRRFENADLKIDEIREATPKEGASQKLAAGEVKLWR
jgi:hypothetical protein